jgi:hypothetical protein
VVDREFPILSQFVLAILEISAMSIQAERVLAGIAKNFSMHYMVKHALTAFQSKPLPEIVGADQVCIALYQSKLFTE